jgi:molecular chaperone GrpE (heat shock protein)
MNFSSENDRSQPSPRDNSTPRRLSKAAAIKKENLEKRLARLSEDYATVNDQIDREGDGDKRNQLQRKADDFLAQMEKLESEMNKLDELN